MLFRSVVRDLKVSSVTPRVSNRTSVELRGVVVVIRVVIVVVRHVVVVTRVVVTRVVVTGVVEVVVLDGKPSLLWILRVVGVVIKGVDGLLRRCRLVTVVVSKSCSSRVAGTPDPGFAIDQITFLKPCSHRPVRLR